MGVFSTYFCISRKTVASVLILISSPDKESDYLAKKHWQKISRTDKQSINCNKMADELKKIQFAVIRIKVVEFGRI